MNTRQLTKSANNRMVSGVIAGICEYFGWGPDVVTILRILYVVLAFSSMGGLILLYFVASWIMPSSVHGRENYTNRTRYYQERWEDKADRFEEKMNRKAQKWEDKARRYENKWSSNPWQSTGANENWNSPWEASADSKRKMKDAEPVEKEEDWSDF